MNSMKRFFAICLCLAMLFSLTACGKESNGDQQQPAKDFVYTTEFKTLEDADGRFREAVIRDGKMYYIKWTYDEETGRGGQTFCTMDMDTMQTTEVPLDQSQNGGTAGMSVLEDGSILMVSTDWDENGQSSFAPVTMDANGQETARHDITAPMMQGSNPEFGVYPQAVEVDPEGNVYVIVGGQTEKIIVFNLQGQKMFELTTDNWYQGLCQSADGRVFAMCYDNSATGSGYMLQYIDVKAKSFGDSFKGIPNGNGGTSTAKGGENEILISTGNILYSYNLADQTCEEILNWIDCDINSNQIEKFSRLDDGRILAFTMNYEAADGMPVAEAVYLTKTPASEVKQKTILTYGTMYLDSEARPRIIQFNKTNETYRIEVKEYGTGDYQAGMTQMNSDIVSGNAPDIIDLNGINTNVNTYIAKGVLTDLYALLDQDENLKRDDFVANVLKNFEQDGKLYGIPVKFTISTVMGRTSVVGDKMGWTVADVQKLMASQPADVELLDYASRESMMWYLLMMNSSSYVDWSHATCSFDSDEFVRVLEFANTFPPQDTVQWDENYNGPYSKISQGKLLLQDVYISNVQDYLGSATMFGEPVTCIGYPTPEGIGTVMNGNMLYGISEKSQHKDGAWTFIRTMLSEEFQSSLHWDFPVLERVLQQQLDDAMDPEKVVGGGRGMGDFDFEYRAATAEEIKALRAVIDSAQKQGSFDEKINNIIMEEAAPFFAGQKSAREAADIIQSRVKLYISENS